jgi:hypothetical protein
MQEVEEKESIRYGLYNNNVRFDEMKRYLQLAVFLLAATLVTGCATPYITDRGRDAADIFTAAVGAGAGAKVRIGPLAQGVCVNMNYLGVQDGSAFCGYEKYEDDNGMDGAFLLFTFSRSNRSEIVRNRNKSYFGYHLLGVACPFSLEGEEVEYPKSYFTQIEVIAGFGGTIKLGFNPGELLDFILGWTTIDIFSDDFEARKKKSKIDPSASVGSGQIAARTD